MKNHLFFDPLISCSSIFCKIGDLYFNVGNYSNSKTFYEKALKLNAGSYKALCGLGFINLLAERHEKSLLYFETAVKESPLEARAYKGLGDAYKEIENFSNAEDFYKKALLKNNSYFKAKLALIDLYIQNQKFDLALMLLKECDSEKQIVQYLYARLFYLQEEYIKALKYLLPLFEKDSSQIELAKMIGEIFYNQGKLEDSIKYFEKYSATSLNFETLFLMAAAHDRLGNIQKAILIYKKALEINPNSAEVLYRLGLQASIEGAFSKASIFFEKATILQSEKELTSKITFSLAYVEAKLNNTHKAIELYESCLAAQYNESDVIQYLIELYEKNGSYAKAEDFRKKL